MFGLESGCRITNTTTSHNGFSLFEIHRRQKLQEKDFGRIQIDRVLEMQKWADNIKTVEDERIKLAIIAANNHYAGFELLC